MTFAARRRMACERPGSWTSMPASWRRAWSSPRASSPQASFPPSPSASPPSPSASPPLSPRASSPAPSASLRLGGRLATQEPHLRHLEAGQLLAVAGAAAVALLGLVLEDLQLRAAQMLGDHGLDLDLVQLLAVEHHVLLAAVHHGAEVHLGALVGRQVLDQQGDALLSAVLLAACFDYRVGSTSRHLTRGRLTP